jgi:hypothetical protein
VLLIDRLRHRRIRDDPDIDTGLGVQQPDIGQAELPASPPDRARPWLGRAPRSGAATGPAPPTAPDPVGVVVAADASDERTQVGLLVGFDFGHPVVEIVAAKIGEHDGEPAHMAGQAIQVGTGWVRYRQAATDTRRDTYAARSSSVRRRTCRSPSRPCPAQSTASPDAGVVPGARTSAAPIYRGGIWLPIEVPQHFSPQTAPELPAPPLSSPSLAVKAASHRGRAISGPLPTLMAPKTRSGGPSRWKCPMVGPARLLSKASRAEKEASRWHCWVRTWPPSDPAHIGHAVP